MNLTVRQGFYAGLTILGLLLALSQIGRVLENVGAQEVIVIQYPNGSFNIQTEQGWTTQWFGQVTSYSRVSDYKFTKKIRFNDGGHADIEGSVNWKMPLDEATIIKIHRDFGSMETIEDKLVTPVVNRSIYMAGALMSSKESYAEKRPDLLSYINDQIENGVYRSKSEEVKTKDPITEEDKTITVVKILYDSLGQMQRQEDAFLKQYGVATFNFSIDRIPYDEMVEKQIEEQQQRIMDVQTAIAESKKAEQRAITVAEQGKADAAKAKWEQEVIKAQAVTEGEQKLAVARLDAQSAEQYKLAQTLRGEGDAIYKRKVMEADGALTQKLATYERVNEKYADAIATYKGNWVPLVQTQGGANGNGANDLIQILTAKMAKELGFDPNITNVKQ